MSSGSTVYYRVYMEVVIDAGMLWVVVQHPAASDVQVHADCFSFLFGWKKYILYVSKFPYLTENKGTWPSYNCLVILSNNFFYQQFYLRKI